MATPENKALAKYVLNIFGGTPNVKEYLDEEEKLSIDLLSCPYTDPDTEEKLKEVTYYCTLGLSDYPMHQDGKEFAVRLEIVGACYKDVKWFPNTLATSAFYVIKKGWLCRPGVVLSNIVHMYEPTSKLQHLYFTAPFLWENELKTIQLETKKVSWLMAIPITDSEYKYLQQYGDEKFEELLQENEIDICDIERESIVKI